MIVCSYDRMILRRDDKINNEIARPGLSSLDPRGQLGAQPNGLARPGWLRPCPGRLGWLDLKAPGASGSPWLVRCGLEWLDLGALGALAGSLWTPRALLARLGCPTTAPSTRVAKKSICLSTIMFRCCLLHALWNVSSCLKLVCYRIFCETPVKALRFPAESAILSAPVFCTVLFSCMQVVISMIS